MAQFIGLDLGGTNIKAGAIDDAGRVLARSSIKTNAQGSAEAVVAALADAARTVAREAGTDLSRIDAVGIGSPGIIDFDRGLVVGSPNLPGLRNTPLQAMLSAALGRPAVIENDANAAALGEFWRGAGRDAGVRHLVALTLGTGVGSGIILDGHVVHGATGAAGEVGHVIVVANGRPCGCGQRGCLEAYSSASAVARIAAEAVRQGEKSILPPGRDLATEEVFAAAARGDAVSLRVIDHAALCLALACINLCRTLDPQMFVFSGGMALAGESIFGPLRRHVREHWWTVETAIPQLVPATLGNDTGIVGAAAVAWDAFSSGRVR